MNAISLLLALAMLGYRSCRVCQNKRSFLDNKKLRHKVIGFDINKNRIHELNNG